MTEDFIKLNVQEIGIILSAIQLLEHRDENVIAKEYGSASTLYHRLQEVYDRMDQTVTQKFEYEEASF